MAELTLEEKRQKFAEALGLESWAEYEREQERLVRDVVHNSPLLSGWVMKIALEKAGITDTLLSASDTAGLMVQLVSGEPWPKAVDAALDQATTRNSLC